MTSTNSSDRKPSMWFEILIFQWLTSRHHSVLANKELCRLLHCRLTWGFRFPLLSAEIAGAWHYASHVFSRVTCPVCDILLTVTIQRHTIHFHHHLQDVIRSIFSQDTQHMKGSLCSLSPCSWAHGSLQLDHLFRAIRIRSIKPLIVKKWT